MSGTVDAPVIKCSK